jgi:hypothetical protein
MTNNIVNAEKYLSDLQDQLQVANSVVNQAWSRLHSYSLEECWGDSMGQYEKDILSIHDQVTKVMVEVSNKYAKYADQILQYKQACYRNSFEGKQEEATTKEE